MFLCRHLIAIEFHALHIDYYQTFVHLYIYILYIQFSLFLLCVGFYHGSVYTVVMWHVQVMCILWQLSFK